MKEVPEENVSMVEDEDPINIDECLYADTDLGKAIIDFGATRTIVGEDAWKLWLEESIKRGKDLSVTTTPAVRDFRFGDGGLARSHYDIEFRGGHPRSRCSNQSSCYCWQDALLAC